MFARSFMNTFRLGRLECSGNKVASALNEEQRPFSHGLMSVCEQEVQERGMRYYFCGSVLHDDRRITC